MSYPTHSGSSEANESPSHRFLRKASTFHKTCVITYALNPGFALAAGRRKVLLVAMLAVHLALLFDKADVLQRTSASSVGAHEVFRAPRLSHCRHEGSSEEDRKNRQ